MTKCSLKPATAEAAEAFYGRPVDYSFKGIVAVEDEKVIGIGGIYRLNGHRVAFTDMKPEMRRHKREMVKSCRLLMNMIRDEKAPVYAVANQDEPTAADLLTRLGFEPTGLYNEVGETLVWREE